VRFWVRSAIGVGLFVASVLVFNLKLVALLNTGTCASGNQPYVIARECPDGTGTDVLLLVLSIFGLFISAGFFIARGDPPNGRRPTGFPWILAWWGIFFGVTGAVALTHALTSDTAPPSSASRSS
jgi:hypothetical protein